MRHRAGLGRGKGRFGGRANVAHSQMALEEGQLRDHQHSCSLDMASALEVGMSYYMCIPMSLEDGGIVKC